MARPITPRCLVGLSAETLKSLKKLLAKDKESNPDLSHAIDQLIEITNKSAKPSKKVVGESKKKSKKVTKKKPTK